MNGLITTTFPNCSNPVSLFSIATSYQSKESLVQWAIISSPLVVCKVLKSLRLSVCLFVCLHVCCHTSKTTHPKFTKCFSTLYLRPWLGPPLTAMQHVTYFRFGDDMSINVNVNQSWIYIAHKRKASNALITTTLYLITTSNDVMFSHKRAFGRGQNKRRHVYFAQFFRWRHQSDVRLCVVWSSSPG